MTAARWTCRRRRNASSVGDMLDKLEWPSLESRREQSSLTFFYKIHLGMVYIVVVVVRIFNATRHPRHIEAAAIVMCMYLYSLAFMDHPCTLGAAVCHQAPSCPLYTQPRARRV